MSACEIFNTRKYYIKHKSKINHQTRKVRQVIPSPIMSTLVKEFTGRMSHVYKTEPSSIGDYMFHMEIMARKSYGKLMMSYKCEQPKCIMDFDNFSKNKPYFSLGYISINIKQSLLAFTIDTIGGLSYTVYMKGFHSHKVVPIMKGCHKYCGK